MKLSKKLVSLVVSAGMMCSTMLAAFPATVGAVEQGTNLVPQSSMTATARSEETSDDYNPASYAIDGDSSTHWHTAWQSSPVSDMPGEYITLTLDEPVDGIYQLQYLPRQDGDEWNGTILDYGIEVSYDGSAFVTVAEGTWARSKDLKTATFTAENGVKAVRLTAYSSAAKTTSPGDENKYASAAEINLAIDADFVLDFTALENAVDEAMDFLAENLNENSSVDFSDLTDAVTAANELISNPDYVTQEAIEEAVELLEELLKDYSLRFTERTTFTGVNEERMYDSNGNVIQAHGGQISYWDGVYYWYGEDKSNELHPVGVHMYYSEDLYNWHDGGVVMRTLESYDDFENDEYFKDLYGDLTDEEKEEVFIHIDMYSSVVERPKVIYNETTEQYVMWFHADGPYNGSGNAHSYVKAMAGVAVADSPDGPFTFLEANRLHYVEGGYDQSPGMARDMNLFVDHDGTAYIIYSSEENMTMFISVLDETYTKLAKTMEEGAEIGVDFTRNFINGWREAPAMFYYDGLYYLMTSGCTGWAPNPAEYAVAEHPLGPWTVMGDPCIDDVDGTTFYTQSTCIFPIEGDWTSGKFIYMGDRWYNPDEPHNLNVSDSRYVWLPVEFGVNNELILREYGDWTLDELEFKQGYTIAETFPSGTLDASTLTETLPDTIDINMGLLNDESISPTLYEDVSVEWNVSNSDLVAGTVDLNGVLTGLNNRIITLSLNVYQGDAVYFIDANGTPEHYHSGFADVNAVLENDVPDQQYVEGSTTWGYTATNIGSDASTVDMGSHSGTDVFSTGWWAGNNKSIDYRITLPAGEYTVHAGFQEWWSTSRTMNLIVRTVNGNSTTQIAQSGSFPLAGTDKALIEDVSFELTEEAVVEFSVVKVSGGDPVLSWLSVTTDFDTTALDAQVKAYEAENLNESDYSAAKWAAYTAALENAKALIENPTTHYALEEALEALQRAYEVLLDDDAPDPVDKIALQSYYASVKDTEKGDYTDASWNAFQDALAAAAAVLADDDADQDTVDVALAALEAAFSALAENAGEPDPDPEPADKDALEAYYASVKDTEKGGYTDASWNAFQDALAAAVAVLADDDADQDTVDAALTALQAAFGALTDVTEESSGSESEDEESGLTGSDTDTPDTGDSSMTAVLFMLVLLAGSSVFAVGKRRAVK